MDKFIKRFDAKEDKDLMITKRGIAYQKDMSKKEPYDQEYFDIYAEYDGTKIAEKLNEGRVNFVNKYTRKDILDIGIGSGAFITARGNAQGYDVNPVALQWLADNGYYSDQFGGFLAFSFWDVLEHVEDPGDYLKRVRKHAYVFASIPIVNIKRIRNSKHYRPGIHLYYFTEDGFVTWMAMYGFRLLETSDFEIKAGREDIKSFAFKKDLPDYRDMVGQYRELHDSKHYGDSAYMYLEEITEVVKELNPQSILDYGCGRSDLVAHFYKDGERELYRYDPALARHKLLPSQHVDMVLCCDVMEHILIGDIDRVFSEIKIKSNNVLFTIFLDKSRAKLPDGRNAHVTLLRRDEWMSWVKDAFGKAVEVDRIHDKILMVKTW